MINNIPKNWEIKTLAEVCTSKNSNIVLSSIENNTGKYPIYGAKGFLKTIDFYTIENESLGIVKDGAGVGRIFLLPEKSSLIGTMAYIQANENLNLKYLYHFLHTINFNQYISGSAIPHIYFRDYKKEKIPLPPLEVQKAIVEKLENAFAHIDEAVRHLKSVQTNIPRLKSSLLHCAFSGKLTESQNSSHKVQTLKSVVGVEGEFEREEGATSPFKPLHPLIKEEIPQGWEIKTLGEVFKVIGGGTPSTANPKFWSGNIAWITSANIENENFTIIPKKFINQSAIQASATNLVPKNTIIVVTRVGLGKVGITDVETCFSQDSQALLPLIDLNVKFMAFQIRNKAQNFIVSSRGTTINGITKDTLKKVALKIPPLATQNQIVQILESKFAHLEKLEQFVNASLENLQKLKSSLLNQAFKGELIC
ncbi:restriction endonuclease subunit S [Helicobacter hepaticus]|jgi:type I restriction enzyme S subunit|uniref:Type I restriction modification DNA specificity domain-containing protein n=1 Tax=Helicobacter hepaticus (strain ATCC 51449 / 3B1) TaxID=235279 RepID=Q7VGA1_HELHP|nr:restriction endonuclease subunit S [Helicobacter hepaticus]AAP78018.1 hypothetical protein HH_1421 [Helicobacter hepaticus ATCC 51449]